MKVKRTRSNPPPSLPPLVFDQPFVLLVEGGSDAAIAEGLAKAAGLDGLHIHDMGGRSTSWSASVSVILDDSAFRACGRAIGLLRDADDNPPGAFRSCCDVFRVNSLTPPSTTGGFAITGIIKTGVFIVPGRGQTGAIEKVLAASFAPLRGQLAREYLSAVATADLDPLKSPDKALVQAYLAVHPISPATVNQGVPQKAFDLASPAFDDLRAFIVELCNP